MRKIKEIILHCSDTKCDEKYNALRINEWHIKRGFKCIGYHFVILPSGRIQFGRPINEIGAHCQGHNKYSVGVCYIGGQDDSGHHVNTMTRSQMDALTLLLYRLMCEYNLKYESIKLHNEYTNVKVCPCFNREWFDSNFKLPLTFPLFKNVKCEAY